MIPFVEVGAQLTYRDSTFTEKQEENENEENENEKIYYFNSSSSNDVCCRG